MRNDELKHYGVKGMKWRQHKYKTRDGSDGDYGYNYGNNNGSNNREYNWDSSWQTGWKGGYQTRRKAQSTVRTASGHALNGSNKYKVVNMYGDEPVKPANSLPSVQQRHSRKRTSGSGTRTPDHVTWKYPVQQEFGVMSKNTATTRKQNRQKAKNSSEVRVKTLGEALGKVGKSVSVNSSIGKRKLKNKSRRTTSDVMGGAVRSAKRGTKNLNTSRKIKRSAENTFKRFEVPIGGVARRTPPVNKRVSKKYTSSEAKRILGDTVSKSLNNSKKVAPKNAKKTGINYMSESTKNKYKAKSAANKAKDAVDVLKDFKKKNTKKKTSETKGVNKFSPIVKTAYGYKSGLDSMRKATFNTAQSGFKAINNNKKKKKKKTSNGLTKTVKNARKAGARKARQATINKGIKDWVKNALFMK